MKILFDPQVYFWQQYGGISRYCTEVYRLLKTEKEIEVILPLFESNNLHLKNYGLQPKLFTSLAKVIGFRKLTNFDNAKWSKKKVIKILKKGKVDVFVPSYYDSYFLEALGEVPYVLTIHDMIYELFPKLYTTPFDFELKENKRRLIEKASRIMLYIFLNQLKEL